MASSLTIAPSLGHSVVTAQGMAGGYDAIDDRSFWGIGRQEGAVEAGAYMVTERGAGANMTVDVACDDGHVIVEGDTVDNQGLYVVRPHPSAANLDIATAHSTNPRVDSVVVQVDDDEHDSGGNTRARVMVLTGTATSGATLDNRTGAPTLPDSALLVADVLVPASDTSISNSQIRDRRRWANGAHKVVSRTSNAAAGNDYSTSSTSATDIDATNIAPRVELSGKATKVTLRGAAFFTTSEPMMQLQVLANGVAIAAARGVNLRSASIGQNFEVVFEWTPAAGSFVLKPQFYTNAGTVNVVARSSAPFQFVVEEDPRQDAANDSTTSG